MSTRESAYDSFLSKSQFVRGLQCHKSLWLHKYCPELRDEASTEQVLLQSGTDVGILARRLFPGGVEVPYDGLSFEEQVRMTANLLEKGISTIYEATFRFDDVFVKVDILHKGPKGWELYEVKSSTGAKDVYLNEIAVQYHVASGAGIPISRTSLVHIDNKYVRSGEIEINRLFAVKEVTETITGMQGMVVAEISRMREMLREDVPSTDIGPHCTKPYECDFHGHCWAHIPKNSVFDLGGNGVNKFALYGKGVIRLEDVPLDILSRRQRIQAESYQRQRNHIDINSVKSFLDSLWYPLCFLDFETTYMTPVPLLDGTKPYQQVPFQYSLHVLDHEGSDLRHLEFLAEPTDDPRKSFVAGLLAAVPENACVLTYNQLFENSRMKELAAAFPEYAERLNRIIGTVRDLMTPFRSRHIYYPEMGGSYSIKVVLPALVPDLGYDGLEVSNGAMAAEAYLRMRQSDDPGEIARLRSALLEYCKLDTLAMVRILDELRRVAYGR